MFIQAVVFAVTITFEVPKTRLTLLCHALTIIVYGLLLSVSYLEHLRSVRPSTLLSVYIGTSILLDAARVRTLFFIPENEIIAGLFLAGFTVKILIFIFEVSEKRRLLRSKWQDASPEETSGAINRALFIWLNHIFLQGFRTLLTVDALTPLDSDLLEASKPSKLVKRWEEGMACPTPFNSPTTYISRQPIKQATTLFYGHFWPITNGALGPVLSLDLLTVALVSHSRSLLDEFSTLLQKLEAPIHRISPTLSSWPMQSYI